MGATGKKMRKYFNSPELAPLTYVASSVTMFVKFGLTALTIKAVSLLKRKKCCRLSLKLRYKYAPNTETTPITPLQCKMKKQKHKNKTYKLSFKMTTLHY